MHDVIFENGGEIFVSLNTLLCVNVALVTYSVSYELRATKTHERVPDTSGLIEYVIL